MTLRNAESAVWWTGALCLVSACFEGAEPPGDADPQAESGSEDTEEPADDASTSGAPQGETGDEGGTTSQPDPGTDEGDSGTKETGEDEDTSSGETASGGMVLTLANPEGENAVVAFARGTDGTLERLGEFATGGMGTGGGLGSQSALALGGDLLYVVNPGDDSVSSMRIYEDHVALVDIVDTEGTRPTSLTVWGDRLYVLNADGAGSVVGFELDEGLMSPIPGASQVLSGAEAPAPGQIGITPEGDYVLVTERATNQILTYAVEDDGSLGAPVVNPSEGQTPFGFQFTESGVFVVAEAFGGGSNPGASAASSYRVADGGGLWTFSASIANGQTATCWIQLVDGRFAYTTNTGSNTVTGYTLSEQGELALMGGSGVAFDFGEDHRPIDMTASEDQRFVYMLNGGADEIAALEVLEDGSLVEIGEPAAIPATAVGLLGY